MWIGPSGFDAVRSAIFEAFDGVAVAHPERHGELAALFAIGEALGVGVHEATFRGRALFVAAELGSGRSSSVEGVWILVRLPDIPFRISISGRRRLGAIGEAVDVGDPSFSAVLDADATSPELARELLDAPTRARLVAIHGRAPRGATTTFVDVVGDKFRWFVPVRALHRGLLFPGAPMTVEDLHAGADDALAFADRLVAAFNRRRDEAHAHGGQPAADAFVAAEHARVANAKLFFRTDVVKIVIAVGAVMLVGFFVVIAFVALALWQASSDATPAPRPPPPPAATKHRR
jgi:hypothetical protein